LNEHESKKDPAEIKKSLDELVQKLEQGTDSSASWEESISSNSEKWEETKQQIQERQKSLKQLVADKKAGLVGTEEFNERYNQLQDELSELERTIFNMKLGTDI